jgi:uncharacterized membrane protein YeaQ/YmgE (transglycosylase-associated protein family)
MLSLAGLIFFGVAIGIVAKFLMPRRDSWGEVLPVVLGVAGSVLGGAVGRVLDLSQSGAGAVFFLALLGAVSLLTLYRFAFHPVP